MDFTTVLRTCLNFAVANNCSLQSFSEGVQKVGIEKRGERMDVYVERGKGGLWDIFSVLDGKNTGYPSVSSRDMLLNTLTGIFTTPVQTMDSLMDAKLADVHRAIERNTALLEEIVNSLHKLLKKEEAT